MVIVDANVILRYFLDDIEDLAIRSKHILENLEVFIPNEIVAEVVFVLQKFYEVPRNEISSLLTDLIEFENIDLYKKAVLIKALDIYKSKNLDFVDCILCAYKKVENIEIKTFDKELLKCTKSDNVKFKQSNTRST